MSMKSLRRKSCGDISEVPRGYYISGCLFGGVVRRNTREIIIASEKDNGKWILARILNGSKTGVPGFPKYSQYEYDSPLLAAKALNRREVIFSCEWGSQCVPVPPGGNT